MPVHGYEFYFSLVSEHTKKDVFDDFLKISHHFPKISEDFPKLSR